jgi:hypothetical protein
MRTLAESKKEGNEKITRLTENVKNIQKIFKLHVTQKHCPCFRLKTSWDWKLDPGVTRLEEMRNSYTILVGNPEGKRLHGRPRRRWESNVKMGLKNGIGGCGVDSCGTGQGPVAGPSTR